MKHASLTVLLTLFLSHLTFAEVVYSAEFEAKEFPVGNMLTWSTLLEENNRVFIVERSDDGVEFRNVGMVDSKPQAGEETPYRFLDTDFPDPRSYYRLKQVDTDGTSSYTHTLVVDKELVNQFAVARIRQAQVTTTLDLTIDARTVGELVLTLTNYRGDSLETQAHTTIDGLNEFSFDLSGRELGIYQVTMTLGEETERIAVLRVAGEAEKKPAQASKN